MAIASKMGVGKKGLGYKKERDYMKIMTWQHHLDYLLGWGVRLGVELGKKEEAFKKLFAMDDCHERYLYCLELAVEVKAKDEREEKERIAKEKKDAEEKKQREYEAEKQRLADVEKRRAEKEKRNKGAKEEASKDKEERKEVREAKIEERRKEREERNKVTIDGKMETSVEIVAPEKECKVEVKEKEDGNENKVVAPARD